MLAPRCAPSLINLPVPTGSIQPISGRARLPPSDSPKGFEAGRWQHTARGGCRRRSRSVDRRGNLWRGLDRQSRCGNHRRLFGRENACLDAYRQRVESQLSPELIVGGQLHDIFHVWPGLFVGMERGASVSGPRLSACSGGKRPMCPLLAASAECGRCWNSSRIPFECFHHSAGCRGLTTRLRRSVSSSGCPYAERTFSGR